MSTTGLLDELMAGFVGATDAHANTTSAKTAKTAKIRMDTGVPDDSPVCEGLRIPAKSNPDSQVFAALRNHASAAQAQHPCGISQESQDSQGCPSPNHTDDPDRWCWPNDPSLDAAINGAEIETLQRRFDHFQRQGVGADVAEMLAHKLSLRDREGDDRAMCLECAHLRDGTRCTAWERAGLDSPHVAGIRAKLQRCPAFAFRQE